MRDLSSAAWEQHYQDQDTPWDLSGPTPEFRRLFEDASFRSQLHLKKRPRALVPGGGRGHDAILLAQCNYEVDLVDFAPTALLAAMEAASLSKVTLHPYKKDFFSLPQLPYHHESYDLLLEYTFFCAIDPSLRPQYVQAAASLLQKNGWLVGLFFPLRMDKEGPPFPVSRAEVEELFSPYFELTIEEPQASVKPRQGNEFLGIFRRK